MNAAEFAQLLAEIPNMNHQQRKQLLKGLAQQSDNREVIEMIETSFDVKAACPHCACTDLYRHGVVNGLQRYRCKNCQKTFNALTKTPLARLRKKQKWLSYLAAMADSQTVRKSAANTGVHRNTSFRWRHRFLRVIAQDRPAQLQGITEVDETYLLESDKGQRHLNRAPRKRGGRASKFQTNRSAS